MLVKERKDRKGNRKFFYVYTFRGYGKIKEMDNGSNQKTPNITYYGVLFGFFDINYYTEWMFLFPNAQEIISLGNRQFFLNLEYKGKIPYPSQSYVQ